MFNGTANVPSVADIAAVTGNDRNNNGWMDGNGWWVLIILFALFGGWGGGWGTNGNPGYAATAATQADIQRGFDNQAVISKLNGLENGICDGMYAVNTGLLTSTNTIQNAIQQGNLANLQNTYALQQSIDAGTVSGMQNANALQSQLQNCCCENREAIAQVRYDMSTGNCAITNAINQQTQAIMQNCNNNYRAIHDEIIQNRLDAKDAKIAEQASTIQALNFAASQAAQNQYLVNQLRPAAIPSFNVPNPYASYGFGCYSNQCCNNG